MRGVVLDLDTLDRNDLDLSPVKACGDITWQFYGVTQPAQIEHRIRDCEIVVCNKVVFTREVLTRARRLKLIVVAATGTNNIDLAATGEMGITVCNVRGYGTPSIVQHVYALILALTTRLPLYMAAVAEGAWQRHPHFCFFDYPIREIAGCTLGIIGYGTLGRGVAAVAPAFGMDVVICQRPGGPPQPDRPSLERMLPKIDILSLHCPLTEQTRGLIGAEALAAMKDDAILINTARGGIVDERALVQALRDGTIGGAGVDVLTEEPPTNGNVLLEPGIPNLIVTPHIAWASRQSRQRVMDIVADNISSFLAGAPRNVV